MRITMVGTGYVGLVTGTCLSEMGNNVICVDINKEKIDCLRQGKIPIYEPGLAEMVKENQLRGQLHFSTELKEAIAGSDLCFIAVGTPMGEDGSADLQYVVSVAKEIGRFMTHHLYVVDKSTVPVGTADLVRQTIQAELDKLSSSLTFDVISNPEFLKEGTACADFLKPDRVVVGVDNEAAAELMQELYAPFVRSSEKCIIMDIKSAELTKYAANAMLATKISFINEMANICERVGGDINKVRIGIGSDSRIGYSFIYPGCGYGGSCFPKDVQALIKMSDNHHYTPQLLHAVEQVNQEQKMVLVQKVLAAFGEDLRNKTFAVWGLAFKPETDDMRQATSITVVNELAKRGATLRVYDPQAMQQAKSCYLKDLDTIVYCNNKYDALNGAQAMLLLTEWKEFRSPDFIEMKQRMNGVHIFDGRNQYKEKTLRGHGFIYQQIGVAISG